MTVLGQAELFKRIAHPEAKKRLTVTPLLSKKQVGSCSIDVRLGNEFIVVQKTRFSHLDLSEYDSMGRQVYKYQARVKKKYGKGFVLQPHQLVLGATLEYLKLPKDLMCYVIGRSSWGRLGLVIATATSVAPGFKGSLTLEIINLGEIPVMVYPGVRIAQLVFHQAEKCQPYSGKHICATGPEFSMIWKDKDLPFWTHFDKETSSDGRPLRGT